MYIMWRDMNARVESSDSGMEDVEWMSSNSTVSNVEHVLRFEVAVIQGVHKLTELTIKGYTWHE